LKTGVVTRNSIYRELKGWQRRLLSQGSHAIAFHECSVTGYSFARHLSREGMIDLAEPVPDGPSIRRLTEIASKE